MWRLAFVAQLPPGVLMLAAGWALPDTPSSLLRRGRREEALAALQRLRGAPRAEVVWPEYEAVCSAAACTAAVSAREGWRLLLTSSRYRCCGGDRACTLFRPGAATAEK